MRILVLVSIVALVALGTFAPTASASSCIRSSQSSEGGSTYVYTSTSGGIGVGLEESEIGEGFGFFVLVQPNNCLGGTGESGPSPMETINSIARLTLP